MPDILEGSDECKDDVIRRILQAACNYWPVMRVLMQSTCRYLAHRNRVRWFGDPDPRIGTPWEKGERLARLVAQRRTLLVLDGLEPLQNPPGPQEGRLREPSLQAFLPELAAFNAGLRDFNEAVGC